MDGQRINDLFPSCLVLARDELSDLPNQLKRPCSIIANTDPLHKPGEHWVALYLPPHSKSVEFFDSYGLSPATLHKDFETFCSRQGNQTIYNNVCLQNIDSQVCAHFCLFFLYSRRFGRSIQDILLNFSPHDKYGNEEFVFNFVYRLHSIL